MAAEILVSGKKKFRIQKYPDKRGQGLCSLFQAPRQSGPRNRESANNITGGNWGEQLSLPSFFLFPAPTTFGVPFSFASSPRSESLEQASAYGASAEIPH